MANLRMRIVSTYQNVKTPTPSTCRLTRIEVQGVKTLAQAKKAVARFANVTPETPIKFRKTIKHYHQA